MELLALWGLSLLGVLLWERTRRRRLLKRLDKMLDAAIHGTFQEERFDESLLSAVESRLAQYLAASEVSARNLREEKTRLRP